MSNRLREAVAEAVGAAVAGAVREAVHTLLPDFPTRLTPPATPRYPTRQRALSAPLWSADDDTETDEAWREDRDAGPGRRDWDRAYEEEAEEAEEVEEPFPAANHAVHRPAPWHLAVAIACQAAAWWLKRQAGRTSLLAALAVSLGAGVAALCGGAYLAESTLNLITLAGTVRSGLMPPV